jgi:hypothetical protein
MGVEPAAFITQSNWADLGTLLAALWMIFGSAAGLGGSMLLAQGMLPSLAATRDLPAGMVKTARPPLYAAAAAFLALGLYSLTLFLDRLDVITEIFYNGAQ